VLNPPSSHAAEGKSCRDTAIQADIDRQFLSWSDVETRIRGSPL
jgi:hypothetical protein